MAKYGALTLFLLIAIVAVFALLLFSPGRPSEKTGPSQEDRALTAAGTANPARVISHQSEKPRLQRVRNSAPHRPANSTASSSRPATAATPAATSTPEPGDPYLGQSLIGIEPGYDPSAAFAEAGAEFSVPEDLLKALAFIESEFDHKSGAPTTRGGRGVMGLRDGGPADTLTDAAALLHVDKSVLVRDPAQNIRGAAALLGQYHDAAAQQPGVEAPWEIAISQYSGLPPEQAVTYAQDVRNILSEGLDHTTSDGSRITIAPGQFLTSP